ncbi:hypothetical protein INR49_024244, partial [Caranx melampygus]
MQNLNQEKSGSTPETTASTEQPLDTGTEAQVALSEPAAGEEEEEEEEEDTTTGAPVETETVIPPQENETGLQMAETPETEACTQEEEKETAVQPLSEPLKNSEEMEIDCASKQSAPADCDTNKDPQCDGRTAEKQEKGPHVGRRYVLSKKAMTDPLKIDMFDPPPLSSPHLSLQCFECHIIFSDYKSKKRHLKLSHPRQYEQHLLRDALFACYVCDRHFTNSSELMAHQKSHTEKKPFKCPLCDQAFIKSSELTRHKKNHFGQDGYACTECGKPCKTLTLLKYHRRTHTGERPYVCKECGKRFTMAKALTKHALTHLPEGAEEEGNPKAKVLQKKTDVRYTCSICKATFKTTKTRRHHMKTKHKSSNTLTADQQVSRQPPEALPTKPKTTRKRKASSKVETEGIITSHSKRALECNDCGERFSEVSSLQKHKATVHIVESPGLTYTNGNVFEGVSRLYQLPKHHNKVVGVISATADWDTEPEMGEMALEDRERILSFPALIPSPSLPVPPSDVEGSAYVDKGGGKIGADDESDTSPEVLLPSDHLKKYEISPNVTSESAPCTCTQTRSLETGGSLASDESRQEKDNPKHLSIESGVQVATDEDIKEDLLLEVEVKEEEEEVLVQRKKEGERGTVTKSATREINGKGDAGTETSQPETNPEFESNKATTPAACLPSVPLDESPEEQVVFELQPVTPSVEEVMDEGGQQEGEQHGRETDQSPGIILEKIVTSSQRETADKAQCLMTARTKQKQGLDSIAENEAQEPGNEEIKVEENISDPPLAGPTCQDRLSASVLAQHHHDIRTVLVKEESSHTLNEAQATQIMQSGETMNDCRISPEFNTNQCIFYPVKEEEREVLLGDTQSSRESLTPERSSAINQTELQTAEDDGSHSSQDYQEIGVRGLLSDPGISDFADGDAEEDAEGPHPPDLRDFLLQSSDEEDVGVPELSDPQLDSEAEVMAYFYKNQTNRAQQPDQTSQNLPSSSKWPQAPRDAHRNREPIDYFSKYFGWDTWKEIAGCTNTLSNLTNPVTKREVAQFVGIHIAMGTLKFPSPRLYWEDLTKVPLIAEAMPLSRFLELSCKLKLASPAEDPVTSNVQKGQHDGDFENGQHDKEDAVEKMAPRGSMVFLCRQELSTPAMLERLLVAGVHGAGRVGGARGQIGDEFVSSDGKLMLRRSHCGFILSTAGNAQRNMASLAENFEKAQMSARLSRDLQNLYPIPLTAAAPTCWPQAVLWYLTDLALINSWLLYRQDHRAESAPFTLMAFRLEVSKALILCSGSDTQDSVPPHPPTERAQTANEIPNPSLVEESPLPNAATRYDGSGHWPEQLAEGEGGRCRYGDCQRTSR